ncbi:hypothetical protein P170DRAFT_439910 [Aspergillus steynii IBT 23096]|uniref:GPI-anchored cell surface glycoprotein n=1 Tax=Aspergillus steynii IBT 23096 TaxID=1392250 RepID=A0A2I2G0A4_9EURO|nr:uncharacterized protein P170DRAFT_439910 [Aspergillus steynii IBT 23096]PLB46304.1 hypothetical protein P170DRAFT_439910 [Aspergillus steynii IBT 23096]
MSLNGLDIPAVVDAYHVALHEAGGWFLLRYVSRDEVALFERGTGGVPDVRCAIDAYEEVSPLYGFLQYRRRKVVLSYLPEGLSRLVQARTTVHFQSVLDKFSPHDTVFTLSQSAQLTESALSSACLLHTASGSITSSSSSLRRRRLMEIAEDAEEPSAAREPDPTAAAPVANARQRSFSQLSDATIVAAPDAQSHPPPPPSLSAVPTPEHPAADDDDDNNNNNNDDHAPPAAFDTPDGDRALSLRSFREDLAQPPPPSESRKSSQSARPSLRDLERTGTYPQKVKRGPRPSVDVNGRPRTAGNLSRGIEQQRPVASLPAGVRSSSLRKNSPPTARPRSQGSTAVAAATPGKSAPPVPPLLVPPLSTSVSRPPLSPGAKSLSALSSSGTSQEKERLMKALQLRKTQLEKKAQGGGNGKTSKAVDGDRPSPQPHRPAAMSPRENKENLEEDQGPGRQEEKSAPVDDSSRSLTPLAEPRPAPIIAQEVTEPSPAADAASLRQTDAEASAPPEIKEVVVPGQADEGPLDVPASTLPPPTDNDDEDDGGEISAQEAAPEAQTLGQPETDAGDAESALPAAKSGPDSPSAVIDVPPEQAQSLKAPEEIIETPSPPTENPVISGALDDDDATGEPSASPIPPPSIPESPPTTVIAAEASEPPRELAPEIPVAQQKAAAHRKDKRKPFLEPIQVPTPDYSDDDNFSDDSFMEELKSATVEEAKPISVGKSPLSPGYSNHHAGHDRTSPDAWRNSRAVSNPSAVGGQSLNNPLHQALAVGRSVSTPYPEMDGATNPVLVAKKINVSSGISKRIQALEKFSGHRDAPSHSAPNLAAPSSASSSFETLRKRASVSLGGHSDTPPSRHASYSPEPFSRAASLRRRDSSAGAPRAPSSVSVTARIVRDAGATPGEPTHGTPPDASGVLHLQPSQLTVEHETADAPSPAPAPSLTPQSTAGKSDQRSMSTSSAGSGPRSVSPTLHRSESRLSVSSASRTDRGDAPSSPEDRRESRTSRILRRMSSITSNSRKGSAGALSPVVKEEPPSGPEATELEPTAEAAQAVDIGEVNVQFPDTLLWKRRFIRIDDKGFVVLTPGNIDSSNRNMIKRYHLTEFRTPCLPDEDCQELPNSILLEFLDGRTLQCACESRQGQAFVLQTLVGAHTAHQSSVA